MSIDTDYSTVTSLDKKIRQITSNLRYQKLHVESSSPPSGSYSSMAILTTCSILVEGFWVGEMRERDEREEKRRKKKERKKRKENLIRLGEPDRCCLELFRCNCRFLGLPSLRHKYRRCLLLRQILILSQ